MLAKALEIAFADAGMWNVEMAYDGVRFSEDGHAAFAKGLFEQLSEMGLSSPSK